MYDGFFEVSNGTDREEINDAKMKLPSKNFWRVIVAALAAAFCVAADLLKKESAPKDDDYGGYDYD